MSVTNNPTPSAASITEVSFGHSVANAGATSIAVTAAANPMDKAFVHVHHPVNAGKPVIAVAKEAMLNGPYQGAGAATLRRLGSGAIFYGAAPHLGITGASLLEVIGTSPIQKVQEAQQTTHSSQNMASTARDILKNQKATSFYRGAPATFVRNGVFNKGYFTALEVTEKHLSTNGASEAQKFAGFIIGGGGAGIAASIPSYAVNSFAVKQRALNAGIPETAKHVFKDGLASGVKDLYRGIGGMPLRQGVTCAATAGALHLVSKGMEMSNQ